MLIDFPSLLSCRCPFISTNTLTFPFLRSRFSLFLFLFHSFLSCSSFLSLFSFLLALPSPPSSIFLFVPFFHLPFSLSFLHFLFFAFSFNEFLEVSSFPNKFHSAFPSSFLVQSNSYPPLSPALRSFLTFPLASL